MKSVLFVCMGNICRSPTAEGYFRHHLAQSPLADVIEVDSAGTHSYHIGDPPDRRSMTTLARRGVDISGLRARKVTREDFHRFDLVLAMDEVNLQALRALDPGDGGDLQLMLRYGARFDQYREVPDPYYGGQDGFELVCDLLDEATRGLLEHIAASRG